MALLGKTLKGRTTRPGGLPVKQNLKVRQMAKTQEQYDQLKELRRIKHEHLKNRLAREESVTAFNRAKIMTYWRRLMRTAKTEELRQEIDIFSQKAQRILDSKEAMIHMLNKNIEEAEEQYNTALKNHLIHSNMLMEVQANRMNGQEQEFIRDVDILKEEFSEERKDLVKMHQIQVRELQNIIATVQEEEQQRKEEEQNEFQAFREEVKNKNLEDMNHMKMILDAKQTKYYNDLEQMHQKYISDTAKKTDEHSMLYEDNKKKTAEIEHLVRLIANKKAKIELIKTKIIQHTQECLMKNEALQKEKNNISNSYHELKQKVIAFREEESNRLKELVNNSRNAVQQLTNYTQLGEKILKTAELCRRLETEKEKVLPFYQSSVQPEEIPEDLKEDWKELHPDQAKEFAYLNTFYQRYNKVYLDKIAIESQKTSLQKDNAVLKSLLKQYLDGISLHDDVLKNRNPLLVINNKVNIQVFPEGVSDKTVIEGKIENDKIYMQTRGAPVPDFN